MVETGRPSTTGITRSSKFWVQSPKYFRLQIATRYVSLTRSPHEAAVVKQLVLPCPSGVLQTNPFEKTRLMAGDIVALLGSRAQIQQAMELLVPTGTN